MPGFPKNVDPMADIHLRHVPFSKPARNALLNKILALLNRLNDVDTRDSSLNSLHVIARSIDARNIPVFLNALYPLSNGQKPLCRQAHVGLFGKLARIHRTKMQPYLPKVIANLSKRVVDKDSRVREGVARSFGEIVACCMDSSGNISIHQFFRGLFKSLARSESYAQIGAAMAIRAIISNSGIFITSALPKLCPKLLKMLIDRNSKALTELLYCAGALVSVSKNGIVQWLAEFIVAFSDGLRSTDWKTRKAALDCFLIVGVAFQDVKTTNHTNEILQQAKTELMPFLGTMKYDKIVNVRKLAKETNKVWEQMTFENPSEDPGFQPTAAPLVEQLLYTANNQVPGKNKQGDWFDPEDYSKNKTASQAARVIDKTTVHAIPIESDYYWEFEQDQSHSEADNVHEDNCDAFPTNYDSIELERRQEDNNRQIHNFQSKLAVPVGHSERNSSKPGQQTFTVEQYENPDVMGVSLKKLQFQQERIIKQLNVLQKSVSEKMRGLESRVHVIERALCQKVQYQSRNSNHSDDNWYTDSLSNEPNS